jgi:hypothetical protein
MNLLIAGGLLAFALLAILVAVFLGISDQRSEQARSRGATAATPAAPAQAAPAAAVAAGAPAAPAGPAAAVPMPEQLAQASRPLHRTIPLSQQLSAPLERPAHSSQPLARQDELPYFAMNGQMREVAEELRSLHQQAWELEQRILSLTELFDRLERTQSRQFSIDEEVTQEHFPAEAM